MNQVLPFTVYKSNQGKETFIKPESKVVSVYKMKKSFSLMHCGIFSTIGIGILNQLTPIRLPYKKDCQMCCPGVLNLNNSYNRELWHR